MAERLRARRRDSYRGDRAPVFATLAGAELSRPNLAGRVLKPAAAAVGLTVAGKDEPSAWVSKAVTADPSRVNAGSTEGPQTAANARTVESADMAL